MPPHRTVIEAGPASVRRICCDDGATVEVEVAAAALVGIDDPVALVGGRPVSVETLWRDALRALACGPGEGMLVVHPSWWPAARVGVLSSAAQAVMKSAVTQPRSALLAQAAPEATVMVEIADRMVVVSGAEVVAVPCRGEPRHTADEVADVVAAMTAAVVLIDVANRATEAAGLAAVLLARGHSVVRVDDAWLVRLAKVAAREGFAESRPRARDAQTGTRMWVRLVAAGVVFAVPAAATLTHQHGSPVPVASTTFLVEGQVALVVPVGWPTQRVIGGPGSARVQVTSPTDPELALHLTQSSVLGETLAGTAQRLQQAIETEPAGTFVDFNPAGVSAGRQAVTYRELRAGHDVWWTVWLDGSVRISVGCQSRAGAQDTIRQVCEQAIRSAHALESPGTERRLSGS